MSNKYTDRLKAVKGIIDGVERWIENEYPEPDHYMNQVVGKLYIANDSVGEAIYQLEGYQNNDL